MAGVQRVDSLRAAAALADLLNDDSRTRPVVVVTTPADRDAPWIDVDEVARETSSLADVFLLPTGAWSWEFSHRMPEGTQVYGGAGRVYPIGHEWTHDLGKSPLRFAFEAADGERATHQLISDALRMAAAAGLLLTPPARGLRQASGRVQLIVAGRALVDIGEPMPAAVVEELTVADVPIDHIARTGQQIEGRYDAVVNRLDVTRSLRPATAALSAYSIGDVVLTTVAAVSSDRAELVLYPRTTTPPVMATVRREQVTANPADDLRTLMSVGEVIPARVAAVGPRWSLVLSDIDDDERVLEAPALLPGGPPWLVEDEETADEPQTPPGPPMPALARPAPAPPRPAPAPRRPTPALLDRKRARSVPAPAPRPAEPAAATPTAPAAPSASTAPNAATQGLLLKIETLSAEIAGLKRETTDLRSQLQAGAGERRQLRSLLDQAERRANKAERDLQGARSRLRKARGLRSRTFGDDGPQFADREQGFRYLVLTRWATRTLPGEQDDRPLPPFDIGPGFLDSLERLEGIKVNKVADVVFEIVTGLAPSVPSREIHRLRTGPGGDDPVRTRSDGAVAWRASLQVNTPSARRIHYWLLPSGRVELARVATHDDYDA